MNGIAPGDYVHAVREDPVRRGMLYAGTEHGVYVSWDDGAHWRSLQLDLPDTQVSDLIVEDHDLVAGTHGRSIYVLDDIDPLRQLGPEVAQGPVDLFQRHAAVRGAGEAVVQFYLKSAPAEGDTVRLEFLSDGGDVVRSFTLSVRTEEARDSASARGGRGGGGGGRGGGGRGGRGGGGDGGGGTVRAGMNEFEWDLRYPGATTFEGMILWSARTTGPLVVPGRYGVRLTMKGAQPATRWFEVKMDPRLEGVTVADLQAQFDLVMKIRDAVSAANQAVIDIRARRNELQDRVAGGGVNATQRAAVDRNIAELTRIEEALYQVRNRSNQDPLNFPIRLNNRLASLQRSVETGDARPTDAAYRVFDELNAELQAHLTALRRALEVGVV